MISDETKAIIASLNEIRDLLFLMAEPAIEKHDHELRAELRKIVGKSEVAAKSVILMNGTHSQTRIREQTQMHAGNLSTLVKKLSAANLLIGDPKQPKLAIAIPANFFEGDTEI